MDRGVNLDVLQEEEGENSFLSEDDSEDERGDGGIRREEPNQFDSLCNGVLNTLSLVHGSLEELLEVKDELLASSLPPNVLTKVSLASTKLYRSVGDMHMPVNELIRMVKIYSTPWEEKSAALKKLHEDYEAKKSQLNIAIKRLQLVDAQSRHMNHQKRIMNWEKLFCRVTAAKGHGRRWKFLIDSFKKKAKEGIPALQRYLDDIERASDSEEEDQDTDLPVESQMQRLAASETEEEAAENQMEETEKTSAEVPQDVAPVHQQPDTVVTVPEYVKPLMKDKQMGTSDPQYDRFLYVRAYCPEGLDFRELKCSFVCGKASHKSNIMDQPFDEQVNDDAKSKTSEENAASQKSDESAPPRKPKRLIGTRASKGTVASEPEIKKETPEPKNFDLSSRHEQMLFPLPEKTPSGILKLNHSKQSTPSHLRVSVYHGDREELIAMASIELADLKILDIPTVLLPPHPESADPVHKSDAAIQVEINGEELSCQDSGNPGKTKLLVDFSLPARFADTEPVNFPLYSIHGGSGDAVHAPCGQIPMVCFWAKKAKPQRFHKTTESQTVNEIVLDVTGIDMDVTTKDDLHPEKADRCISAMSGQDEVKEETVLRSDYNRLLRTHQEEMEMLQEEYEQRLQDLAESMQHMQVLSFDDSPQQPSTDSKNKSSSGTSSPTGHRGEHVPHPPKQLKVPAGSSQKGKRPGLGKSLPHWGKDFPEDFLERLQWFEVMNQKRRQQLAEKTNKEISDNYEKRLAGEFKLRGTGDDSSYNPLDDVTLPAVFMPTKAGRDLTIFNPRASKYFHATGAGGLRLTQPPSMLQLPPLPQNKVNVVNLFDVSKNFRSGGNEWLMRRYFQQQQEQQDNMGKQGDDPDHSGSDVFTSHPTMAYQTPLEQDTPEISTGPMPTKGLIME